MHVIEWPTNYTELSVFLVKLHVVEMFVNKMYSVDKGIVIKLIITFVLVSRRSWVRIPSENACDYLFYHRLSKSTVLHGLEGQINGLLD